MLNLSGLMIILVCFVVYIFLLVRRLFLKNEKFHSQQCQTEQRCQQQEEPGENQRQALKQPLERERLEQLVYNQWEQRLGEQLEQWYGQPEKRMSLELKQAQQLREQLERERKEWEFQQNQQREKFERERQQRERHADSIDKAYIKAHWYRILGVTSTASAEEIKRAYHKCMSEYHPDKVSQMGEKIIVVAEMESQKINAAYEYAQSQGLV